METMPDMYTYMYVYIYMWKIIPKQLMIEVLNPHLLCIVVADEVEHLAIRLPVASEPHHEKLQVPNLGGGGAVRVQRYILAGSSQAKTI